MGLLPNFPLPISPFALCSGLINQDTSKDRFYNAIRGKYEQTN